MTEQYVSLLSFDDDWLQRLRSAVPAATVLQFPGAKPTDLPEGVLAATTMLHTSAHLPDPADAPALRCVQLDTSGVDHVVDTALWRSSVPIATIGGVSPTPLAEYVLFAVLGFAHRLPAMLTVRASRSWPSANARWDAFLPSSLAGATAGVVGFGRIGREIGRLLRAHGMHVIGINRTGRATDQTHDSHFLGSSPNRDATSDSATELVASDRLVEVAPRCDYLVVVCPLTEQTRGLVGPSVLAALKPGAVVVNVARGGIVDEAALRVGLRDGSIAGAALDVFDDEPLPPDSPWWDEPNVFVTPHVSGLAPLYSERVLDIVAANLQRLVNGDSLLNLVNRERGY